MPADRGPETVYRFGDFELAPRERTLKRHDARVPLTPRAFDLLFALVEAEGRLLTKETLLDTVWADAAVEEGNLNRTISALRKALGETRKEQRYIETVPKAGYRFIAPIEKRDGAAHAQPRGGTTAMNDAPEKRSNRRFALVAAISSFVLLFGALIVSYLVFAPRAKVQSNSSESSIVRLTNNGFDEDSAAWTADDKIRFIRFTAVNKVESMIMNADGSEQRRTGTEIRDFRAGTWSPDGRRVLYSKDGTANPRQMYVANADGSGEEKLPFVTGAFDWSADGKQIVFGANFPAAGDNSEIVLYSFETGQATNLTNHPAYDANPSFSPDGKQVIFNSDRDGNAEIYLINADGTGLRRLTNDPAKEAFQSFSPDGTQIVFNSNRENERVAIYLMNVNDDSPPVKISDTKYNSEIRPGCWSRDGTRIVFTSDMNGEKFNVYTMPVEPTRAKLVPTDETVEIRSAALSPDGRTFALGVKAGDGGELRVMDSKSGRMTTLTSAPNYDLFPAWSPDGKSIAFAMKSNGNTEIFSINADGSDLKNLTQNEARDGAPAWSPDGRKLIFSSDRDGRGSETVNLFLMNSDGGSVTRFGTQDGYEMTPAWSPDGRSIAFACDRADGLSQALDIFLADVSAPDAERILTRRRFHDSNPTFSPDGRRIAFVSQSDGNYEIYVMNIDGSGVVRLTRNASDDMNPVFSPDGAKIYFVSNRTGRFLLYEMAVD